MTTTYAALVKKTSAQQASIARALEKAGFHVTTDDSRVSESRYVTVCTVAEHAAFNEYNSETNSFGPAPREFKIRISNHGNAAADADAHYIVAPLTKGDWQNAVAAAKNFFA
jgi:hypothetical protein